MTIIIVERIEGKSMIWIYAIASYLVSVFIFWLIIIKTAPFGFEDENGFHYRKK